MLAYSHPLAGGVGDAPEMVRHTRGPDLPRLLCMMHHTDKSTHACKKAPERVDAHDKSRFAPLNGEARELEHALRVGSVRRNGGQRLDNPTSELRRTAILPRKYFKLMKSSLASAPRCSRHLDPHDPRNFEPSRPLRDPHHAALLHLMLQVSASILRNDRILGAVAIITVQKNKSADSAR